MNQIQTAPSFAMTKALAAVEAMEAPEKKRPIWEKIARAMFLVLEVERDGK